MGASSVTGTGAGTSGKFTTDQLSQLANGPAIMACGRIEIDEVGLTSPPSPACTVYFPRPLPGSPSDYVVIPAGIGTGLIEIATMHQDSDGNFDYFAVFSENEGTMMYTVVRTGFRTL